MVKCVRKHSSIFKVLQFLRDCCMSNTQNYMHIICICIMLINMRKATAYAFFSRVVFLKNGKLHLSAVGSSGHPTCMGKSSMIWWHTGYFCVAAGVLGYRHCLQTHSRKREIRPAHFPGKLAAPGTAFLIFLCRLTAEVRHTANVPVAALVFGSITKSGQERGSSLLCLVSSLLFT